MRWADLKGIAREAERWLLPGECLICHAAVGTEDPLVCPACQSRWRRLPEPQCARCGQPTLAPVDSCRLCAAWPDGIGRARSAVWLDDQARHAVHHLKYGGWWRVAEPMARLMAPLAPLKPGAVLVPIPLARRRLRARGYNQAERLAGALAARTGLVAETGLLIRRRETPTQTTLPPEARRANVADAFLCPPGADGKRVVLIDDVFTTGATLAEAGQVLLEAGAEGVESVTFARARPPLR